MMKVNVPTLEIKDLLDEARKSSNLHWLLLSIYQRWTKYFRLLAEIEPLRYRYCTAFSSSLSLVFRCTAGF